MFTSFTAGKIVCHGQKLRDFESVLATGSKNVDEAMRLVYIRTHFVGIPYILQFAKSVMIGSNMTLSDPIRSKYFEHVIRVST